MTTNASYIYINNSKYNINSNIKNLVAPATLQVLSGHRQLMPPRYGWNIPVTAGSPRGQGCSGVAQTSRGWVLPGEQDGLGRAGVEEGPRARKRGCLFRAGLC